MESFAGVEPGQDRDVAARHRSGLGGRTMTRVWTTLALAVALAGTPAKVAAQEQESVAARANRGAAAMQASRFDEAAEIYAELVAARAR